MPEQPPALSKNQLRRRRRKIAKQAAHKRKVEQRLLGERILDAMVREYPQPRRPAFYDEVGVLGDPWYK